MFFRAVRIQVASVARRRMLEEKCPRAHGYFPPRFLASLSEEKIEVTRSLARSVTQTPGVIRVGSLREVNGCH